MFRAASRPGRAWSFFRKSHLRAPPTTNISKTVSACPYIRRRFPFSWKTSSVQMLTKTAGCILQMKAPCPGRKKCPCTEISPGFGGTKAKNESYYQNRRDFCQSSIHHLTQQIKNAMLVYPQPLKIPSRSGKIFPREVWKALWLDDDRIFMETTDEEQPDFSVDPDAGRLCFPSGKSGDHRSSGLHHRRKPSKMRDSFPGLFFSQSERIYRYPPLSKL